MEPDLIAIKLTTTIWAYPPRPTELKDKKEAPVYSGFAATLYT